MSTYFVPIVTNITLTMIDTRIWYDRQLSTTHQATIHQGHTARAGSSVYWNSAHHVTRYIELYSTSIPMHQAPAIFHFVWLRTIQPNTDTTSSPSLHLCYTYIVRHAVYASAWVYTHPTMVYGTSHNVASPLLILFCCFVSFLFFVFFLNFICWLIDWLTGVEPP